MAVNTEPLMPKRVSFPSILPPDCPSVSCWSTLLTWPRRGFPACSAQLHSAKPAVKSPTITPNSSHPSRGRPLMRPKVYVRAAGSTAIANISSRFVRGGWVLVGMRPIGVKEAAAIGTHVLDKLQCGHWPLWNDLLRHLDRLHDGLTARIGDRIAIAVHAGLLISGWLQQRHRL